MDSGDSVLSIRNNETRIFLFVVLRKEVSSMPGVKRNSGYAITHIERKVPEIHPIQHTHYSAIFPLSVAAENQSLLNRTFQVTKYKSHARLHRSFIDLSYSSMHVFVDSTSTESYRSKNITRLRQHLALSFRPLLQNNNNLCAQEYRELKMLGITVFLDAFRLD